MPWMGGGGGGGGEANFCFVNGQSYFKSTIIRNQTFQSG